MDHPGPNAARNALLVTDGHVDTLITGLGSPPYDTRRCRTTVVSCDGPEVSYDGSVVRHLEVSYDGGVVRHLEVS